ncbi:LppX_LprAFG lipoprotein [Streptomyces sp. NPDC092369]|uniref:LppX_LprAFG lipoprotein n=1 Tax=Streptomyces sp. NPDC092369 TaxID=3366015 RepID=UPI00382FC021
MLGFAGLAVLLCAGCVGGAGGGAGGSSDSSAAAAVARAARATEGVPSVHYRISGRIPEQGQVETEASVAAKPARARMVTTSRADGNAGKAELRLVDGVLYQSMTENGVAQQTHGRHWADFGPDARFTAGSGLKMDVGGLRDQVGRNPARDAAFLAAADDVRRTGTETVAGSRTTHYTGTATLDHLRDLVTGKAKADLAQYKTLGVDELTLDVWVDGDDHVRRLRTQGFGRHGELDLTVTLLDFGTPVTVRAPAADDTVDLREQAGKSRG